MRFWATILACAALAAPAHAQQQAPTPPGQAAPARQVGQGSDGDWAFVDRYRQANAHLRTQPTHQRVVFMGDSITEGWARQPFIAANAKFVGRGISGQTAAQMLVRFPSDVIALKPAAVHIMAGTNDIAQNNGRETPEEIAGYIASMVEIAQANNIKVILASIPPAGAFAWRRGLNPAPQIQALNGWLKAYARKRKIVFVDYWAVLATPEGAMKPAFSPDGVHPNADGYETMRPLAQAAIKTVLTGN
jgi:lysophospholipase L1-like esterase